MWDTDNQLPPAWFDVAWAMTASAAGVVTWNMPFNAVMVMLLLVCRCDPGVSG
jgi:hypothetical protein